MKIFRDTFEEMEDAILTYRKSKDVIVLGESKGGEWVKDLLKKAKAKEMAKPKAKPKAAKPKEAPKAKASAKPKAKKK